MYTIKEASENSGYSVQTIYSFARRKKIRLTKIGRNVFISKEQYNILASKSRGKPFKTSLRKRPHLKESRFQKSCLTSSQVAEHLGISKKLVLNLVKDECLRPTEIIQRGKNTQYFFAQKDVKKLKSYKDKRHPFPKIKYEVPKGKTPTKDKEYQTSLQRPVYEISDRIKEAGWAWPIEVKNAWKRWGELFEYIRQKGWQEIGKISQFKDNTETLLTDNEIKVIDKWDSLADSLFRKLIEREQIPADKSLKDDEVIALAEGLINNDKAMPQDIKRRLILLVRIAYAPSNRGINTFEPDKEKESNYRREIVGIKEYIGKHIGKGFNMDTTTARPPVRYIGE